MKIPRGPEINFKSPTGYICDHKASDLPYFTVFGGTFSRDHDQPFYGDNYRGSYGQGDSAELTAGMALVFPLGGKSTDNCQKFIDQELSQSKYAMAKEMLIDGLITDEQFAVIVKKSYELLISD